MILRYSGHVGTVVVKSGEYGGRAQFASAWSTFHVFKYFVVVKNSALSVDFLYLVVTTNT